MSTAWDRSRLGSLALIAVIALFGASCGGDDDSGGGGGSAKSVGVTLHDFEVTLDPSSAAAGSVDFDIHNDGPSTHEFVIFKTDLAPEDLPLNSDGDVDEEGDGVQHVDEVEDIEANADASLTADLDAGKYVLICNLPGHYKAGMHAQLTVE